jgi:multidrug transporter EmrE-like cation transporter
MNRLCLLVVITILSIIYTLLCKNYISSNYNIYIYILILVEFLILTFYIKLLENNSLSTSYSQITCLSIVAMTIIGIVLYEESINRYIVYGIICAIISILLLSK